MIANIACFISAMLAITTVPKVNLYCVVYRPDCLANNSRQTSGDWKESSPASSAPGAKVRSVQPGIARPRSKSDLTAAYGNPISVQPRSRYYSCSIQSETASDSLTDPDSEGRRSRGFVTLQYHCTL